MEKQGKFKNKIVKIARILFALFFFIIVINAIFLNRTIHVDYSKKTMIGGTIFLFFLLFLLFYLAKKTKIEVKPIYVIISFIVVFLLQIIVARLTYADCGWDCQLLSESALSLFKNTGINTEYFAKYTNNIGMLLLMKIIFWIANIFQTVTADNATWILVIANIIMIDLAGIITILVANKLYGKKGMILSYFFSLPLFLFSPYLIVPYTDTFTLLFPVLVFYFYLCYKEKKQYLYLFLQAVTLMIGYFLKPTCLIIIIAILMVEIGNRLSIEKTRRNKSKTIEIKTDKKETQYQRKIKIIHKFLPIIKTSFIFLLGVGIIMGSFQALKKEYISPLISEEEFAEKSYPMTHFLMMGMQQREMEDGVSRKNTTLYGAFFQEDVNNTAIREGKKEKVDYHKEVIKSRLSDFGLFGYLNFLYQKANWILSDGTFYYGGEALKFANEPYNTSPLGKKLQNFYQIETKTYQKITAPVLQIMWLSILVALIFAKSSKEREDNILILKLAVIGIILFVLLFEGRSRYLFNYVPIFIIVGIQGIKNIVNWNLGKIGAINRKKLFKS